MMTFDDQIRDLLRVALHNAPTPLPARELLDRPTAMAVGPAPLRPRRPRTIVACSLAAASLILIAVVVVADREMASPTNSPIEQVGRYVLPSSLPDGWTLLEATETAPGAASAFDPSRSAIFERSEPPARIQIWARSIPVDDRYVPVNERPFEVAGRVGSWNAVSSMERAGIALDFVRDGWVVTAQSWGVEPDPDTVHQLVAQMSVDATGRPIIDRASGFTLGVASPDEPGRIVAGYYLQYGVAGSDTDLLMVTAEKLDHQANAQLEAGVFAEPRVIGGHDVWVGDGDDSVTWMASPDLRIKTYGTLDATEFFAELSEVTEQQFITATGLGTAPP